MKYLYHHVIILPELNPQCYGGVVIGIKNEGLHHKPRRVKGCKHEKMESK